MQVALELWDKNRHEWLSQIETLRNEFESSIKRADGQVEIIGEQANRLPTTSNVAFLGLDRQALFVALDQAGIACSTGSACASGSSEPSPVHIAMGCRPAVISSALRFSFGVQTTPAEVAESTGRILRICNNLRSQKQS
jgi:cysteine desulfurase